MSRHDQSKTATNHDLESPSVDILPTLRFLSTQYENPYDDEWVRAAVRVRAHNHCEYCQMPAAYADLDVEHVIPPGLWDDYMSGRFAAVPPDGHRGPHHIENYAWACRGCNGRKRQQVFRELSDGREYRLFDPRRDSWGKHFRLDYGNLFIRGKDEIGHATELAMNFNLPRQHHVLGLRHLAILDGVYPPPWLR